MTTTELRTYNTASYAGLILADPTARAAELYVCESVAASHAMREALVLSPETIRREAAKRRYWPDDLLVGLRPEVLEEVQRLRRSNT